MRTEEVLEDGDLKFEDIFKARESWTMGLRPKMAKGVYAKDTCPLCFQNLSVCWTPVEKDNDPLLKK